MELVAVVFKPKRQNAKREPAVPVSWIFPEAVATGVQHTVLIPGDHA